MASNRWKWWIGKPLVFLASLAPIVVLLYLGSTAQLSANPVDDITDGTGHWTLRFLMVTLAITPMRRLTGWNFLTRFRRMMGLFAFFYGILHFTTYIWLDQGLDWAGILVDLPKRPFITAGFTGLVLMLPLALTSTKGWIARLGGKRWQWLHRAIYISGVAAVAHYVWLVKLDRTYPYRYAMLLAVLLGIRAWYALKPPVGNRRVETPVQSHFRP